MTDPVDGQGSSYSLPTPNYAETGEVPKMDLDRTLPRQVSTGDTRGVQANTGENIVRDPTTNNNVINNSGLTQNTVYSDPTNNTPQIVLGKLPDDSYGMKVSPLGTNVLTASDSELIFNSNQNVFKIVLSGTAEPTPGTITASAGTYYSDSTVTTVRHGLNYVPLATGAVLGTTGNYGSLPYDTVITSASNFSTMNVRLSTSNANLYITTVIYGYTSIDLVNVPYGALPVKYYLLQESAN